MNGFLDFQVNKCSIYFFFPLIIKTENKELNTTQMCRCVRCICGSLLLYCFFCQEGWDMTKKMPYCCSSLSNSGASLCDRVISQPVALSTATTNTDSLVAAPWRLSSLHVCVCFRWTPGVLDGFIWAALCVRCRTKVSKTHQPASPLYPPFIAHPSAFCLHDAVKCEMRFCATM